MYIDNVFSTFSDERYAISYDPTTGPNFHNYYYTIFVNNKYSYSPKLPGLEFNF